MIISWDNFDYNQNVRHQTLRERNKHMSATTGIFSLGHYIPDNGLSADMLNTTVPLHQHDVYNAAGNQGDEITMQCWRFWVAEAIRYTHRQAVDTLFNTQRAHSAPSYPEFPSVERLKPRKTPNFELGPILENEGTISGTYQVIDKIFLQQLGLEPSRDFHRRIQLVYGDQKTVSLVETVKRDRQYSNDAYGRYDWLLPIPGLFHWRTNLIDLIYDVYSGSEPGHANIESTLRHNERYMGIDQGYKSPFQHKEEVATRAFDARITAMFYEQLRTKCDVNDRNNVDEYIKKLSPSNFLGCVNDICESIFNRTSQHVTLDTDMTIDHVFVSHCRFLNQMETYRTLKYAIKHGDIGVIERSFARCCLIFNGSKKTKYAFLSLYMTWLTHTKATSHQLRTALLANGLVNLRGKGDSWFEMDRLNEFLNLKLKTLMISRRTSTESPDALFRRAALTSSYCAELQDVIEKLLGEHTNNRHQDKDASEDVYRLAYELYKTGSIKKVDTGRESLFNPIDIIDKSTGDHLDISIEKFNATKQSDEDLDNTNTISTDDLADILVFHEDGDLNIENHL